MGQLAATPSRTALVDQFCEEQERSNASRPLPLTLAQRRETNRLRHSGSREITLSSAVVQSETVIIAPPSNVEGVQTLILCASRRRADFEEVSMAAGVTGAGHDSVFNLISTVLLHSVRKLCLRVRTAVAEFFEALP